MPHVPLPFNQTNLAKRNVKRLFWASLFGGVNFLEPVMVLFYMQRGLEAADVYWVTLAWCLAVLVFEVPTGAFADRFGPKASLITGCIIGLISKVCLLFAFDSYWFFAYNILWGVSVTFYSGAEESLLYESLKADRQEHKMSEVMGRIQSAAFYPMIVGFLFGAYFAKDLADWQFAMLIGCNLLFQAVEMVMLLGLITPKSFESFRENPFVHVKNGFSTIVKTPALVMLFLNFTIIFVASTVVAGKMEQPYLIESSIPVSVLGIVYAAAATVGLLVANHIGWLQKHFSVKALFHLTGAATVVALVIAGFVPPGPMLAPFVILLLKIARTIRYPLYSQLSNEMIPSESRATTLSLLSIFDSLFDVLFLTTFAGIAAFGTQSIFIGCALACLLGLLIPIGRKMQ
ncbi:MAG: MFS transporter [Clostridia bacterium]